MKNSAIAGVVAHFERIVCTKHEGTLGETLSAKVPPLMPGIFKFGLAQSNDIHDTSVDQ
jgi:hypothetical protein